MNIAQDQIKELECLYAVSNLMVQHGVPEGWDGTEVLDYK